MSIQNVLRELPSSAAERKDVPITTGVLDYFPLAIAEIARVSKAGNDQHNPGQPLHWARAKSTDQADCIVRHLVQRGERDSDGQRHTAKVAWRALALLQEELEAEAGWVPAADVPVPVAASEPAGLATDLLRPSDVPVSAWEQLTRALRKAR